MKLVADWARIPIYDVLDMDILDYLRCLRDAFITKLNETEEGRDYLDNAWLLVQTEPDREASRAIFGTR